MDSVRYVWLGFAYSTKSPALSGGLPVGKVSPTLRVVLIFIRVKLLFVSLVKFVPI